MIRLQNLHKFFNKGRQNELHVINDVSLELPDSGMVAIFGKSGCGKTTLLNVIGGLDSFASGSVSIDGQNVGRRTDEIRNQSIGYIFQNYNLNKNESCYDNVADALRLCGMKDGEDMQRRVMAALRCVDMEKYFARTPDTLSGGQQQRIAIARAIVKNPKIILADEPTGNLDEANTLLIMNLLKQIAKDHLVLLVTHEADLVDYYCDTVIELKDGRVENVRHNESADGMNVRDKNHIYLGELPQTELADEYAHVSYYGEAPEAPIDLKIVHYGSKFYVQIGSRDVQVLDAFSEVKLKEGTFNAAPTERRSAEEKIDMSELTPIQGTHFGRLFHFGSAVKSGYDANFRRQKRGKKFLRACLCMFAAVVVFITALFGTAFGDLIDIQQSYSHNTFYLYTPNAEVSAKLSESLSQGKNGIDALYLTSSTPTGDSTVKFVTGYFETFSSSTYDESFLTNAVFLPSRLAQNAKVRAGKGLSQTDTDLWITEAVADDLLDKSSLGYIQTYADLVGLVPRGLTVDGKNLRIAGVVDGDERAVYVSDAYLEEKALSHLDNVFPAERYGVTATDGGVTVAVADRSLTSDVPSVGEHIKIHGKDLTVSRVILRPESYESYVRETYNVTLKEAYEYFCTKAEQEYEAAGRPAAGMMRDERIPMRAQQLEETEFYSYYEDYYRYLDEYLELYLLFASNDPYSWIYKQYGTESAKYAIVGAAEYDKALRFREREGRYPDRNDASDLEKMKALPDMYDVLQPYMDLYNTQSREDNAQALTQTVSFLLNGEDYTSLAYRYGENHALVRFTSRSFEYDYYEDGETFIGSADVSIDMSNGSLSSYVSGSSEAPSMYTVIHSSDPSQTQAYLESEFSDLSTSVRKTAWVLRTPHDFYEKEMEQQGETILTGFITIGVLLVLMSVCMYFIMRSTLMNRIKEVGIYRAIGVSRKNLCFRFFVETLVLTTLTVFVGYLFSSAVVMWLFAGSTLMKTMMYYPIWLALAVLAVLYLLCTVCGLLPIWSLTKKTPSQILAKYDI